MFVIIFFLNIISAIHFFLLSQHSIRPNPIQLIKYDPDLNSVNITLSISTLNGLVGKCLFDKEKIYFNAINHNGSFSPNFNMLDMNTNKISTLQKFIISIAVGGSNIYLINIAEPDIYISQLNWPNITNIYKFESYIPEPDNFVHVDDCIYLITSININTNKYEIIVMLNDGEFKVIHIYNIKYRIASLYYKNGIIYVILYGEKYMELWNINMLDGSILHLITYNNTVSNVAGYLLNDMLYFTTSDINNYKCYFVSTNLVNLTYKISTMPLSSITYCMIPIFDHIA